MNLLIEDVHLLVSPKIARILGLNEALVLQQLHYKLLHSPLKGGGFTWYFHTYANWQEQFPFWSESTISRIFLGLEKQGYIVSTQHYNFMKINKTKWYRIDYDVLYAALGNQIEFSVQEDCQLPTMQISGNVPRELMPSDIKEFKKEEIKEKNVDFAFEIINYLNQKANKEFRVSNKATKRLINARLSEGYTLDDFKTVIDRKARQWLTEPEMKQYLRPSTLFSPTNFENYLNETTDTKPPKLNTSVKPIVLDFEAGEED